jgi:outer membrane protein TolC
MRRSLTRTASAAVPLAALILLPGAAQPARAQVAQPPQQVAQIPATEVDIFDREEADMVLTLQQAIDLALDRSFAVYQLEQNFLQISYALERARRSLRTHVDFTSTLPSLSQGNNARLISGPTGQELVYLREGTMFLNSQVSIRQPLITNGTLSLDISMRGIDSFSEQVSGARAESRVVQPTLGFNFTQPLFQYNDIKGSLRSAELSFEGLQLSYTQDELQRINTMTRQFYQLFRQQRSLQLAAETFRQADVNYQTGLRKYAAGLVAEVEQLGLEVSRANEEDTLEEAKNTHRNQQFTFNRQVGLPLETKVWVDASLEYRPVEVDLDRALQLAFQNRSDLRQAEINLENADLSLQRTISQGRPNLQLRAGYDLTGNSTLSALGPGDSWSDHLSAAFDSENRSPNTNISLSLAIPLFDWGENASNVQRQLSSMRVQERQLDEVQQDLRRDVINAVQDVISTQRRLQIQQQNVTVAETSYNINQQRYERGEITITDLLRELTTYNTTQNRFNDALIDYELAKAALKELTLWDWELNEPVRQRTTPPQPFEKD